VEFTISPKKAGSEHQTAFWVLIMVNNSSLLHNCQASAYLRLIKNWISRLNGLVNRVERISG
jgi:hypothetical protein